MFHVRININTNSKSLMYNKIPTQDTIRYDTRCYFNVRSKADISQLNLPDGLKYFITHFHLVSCIPQNEMVVFAGDMNGHVEELVSRLRSSPLYSNIIRGYF